MTDARPINRMPWWSFTLPSFLLTLVCGLLVGSVLTAWVHAPPPALELLADPGTDVPVLKIDGIRNGALVGVAMGDMRLFAGGKPVQVTASGTFAIGDTRVLTNIVTVRPPAGMQFVASKRGKKYYPLTSSQAGTIVAENRIYFPDAQSAQRAGYTR